MANQFINNPDLVERYVLHQMTEHERLEFEGAMFLNKELRTQVVQTKTIIGSLQAIPASEFALTTTKFYQKRNFWAIAASILIILSYGIYLLLPSSINSDTSTVSPTLQVEEKIPSQQESSVPPVEETKEKEEEKEQIFATTEMPKGVVPALKKEENAIHKAASNKIDEEEISFATPLFDEEEIPLALAGIPTPTEYDGYDTNPYIEAILSDTYKSYIPTFDVQFPTKPTLNNGYVSLDIAGTISQVPKTKYSFKLFSNSITAFENNQYLSEKVIVFDEKTFDIEWNIELEQGLYYLTIYKETKDNNIDMVHATKFVIR